MLLNVDIKQTEWLAINWFSQDKIGCNEILTGEDTHSINQKVFGLPTRTIAKVFIFRLLYGGSAYSYIHDPDFSIVSSSPKYWQRVIDSFYSKYEGIAKQHAAWMSEAVDTSQLIMPTGRIYRFIPFRRPDGSLKWPRTKVLNYPVQGLGHDLTTIARVSLYKRIRKEGGLDRGIKFISTVHDSIVLDLPFEMLDFVRPIVTGVFDDLPSNFNRLFGCQFNLPIVAECSIGKDLLDMQPIV